MIGKASVVVDSAGATMGGASRLLVELDAFLAASGRSDVRILGRGRSLRPSWLLRRETQAVGAARRIALNNVGFVGTGADRIVLLRNALHFPVPGEQSLLPGPQGRRVALEAGVVRLAARRADLLVVPSSSMASRVAHWLPGAKSRTVVWPHPVSARQGLGEREAGLVVCPVLFAPYKRMDHWLGLLAQAAEAVRREGMHVRVCVTATHDELTAAGVMTSGLEALGRLDVAEMERLLARAQAIYYPTTVESFGYPLAEARVNGQPVVAADTSHNREVAGPALVPFGDEVDDLARALRQALTEEVAPTSASNPEEYFVRLLGLS